MEKTKLTNSVLKKLPNHLRTFIRKQPYDEYTPQNQAVWRYVMQKNISYLTGIAHKSYLEGIKETTDWDKYGLNEMTHRGIMFTLMNGVSAVATGQHASDYVDGEIKQGLHTWGEIDKETFWNEVYDMISVWAEKRDRIFFDNLKSKKPE